MSMEGTYRRMRAVVEADARMRGAVTINPQSDEQTDRLSRYLYANMQRQYQQATAREARRWGVHDTDDLTDAVVLAMLRSRAIEAARSIAQTLSRQIAAMKAGGGSGDDSVRDLLARRRRYKPKQVWTHEMRLARYQAMRDFYARHPELAARATAHVEPAATEQEDVCREWIDLGSIPVGAIPGPLPAHPNCPHDWVVETPPSVQGASRD